MRCTQIRCSKSWKIDQNAIGSIVSCVGYPGYRDGVFVRVQRVALQAFVISLWQKTKDAKGAKNVILWLNFKRARTLNGG